MIGLSSTRVVIIDDDVDEALPVIKALSKINIATAFFNGDPEDFPKENQRLHGIRLAILDMDLVGGTADPKSKAAALVNTLSKILSSDNGPYAVVAWTNHPELLNDFEDYIFSEISVPNPVISIMMKKAEARDKKGGFDINVISEALENKLKTFSPLLILQAWEEQSILSAIEVINFLSQLAVPDENGDLNSWRKLWRTRLLELMHVIAHEEAGKKLKDISSIRSVYNAFSPLHADRLESNSGALSKKLDQFNDEILVANQQLSAEGCAKLNSMFHLAVDHLEKIGPGNVYLIDPNKKRPEWLPARKELFEELLKKENTLDPRDKRKIRQILIEITPACDHAQNNIRLARLIPGFFVPEEIMKYFKKPEGFIYGFGPYYFEKIKSTDNQLNLYLSARHFFTTSLENLDSLLPAFRLRSQSFEHLISWFTGHASRPGIMILRSK